MLDVQIAFLTHFDIISNRNLCHVDIVFQDQKHVAMNEKKQASTKNGMQQKKNWKKVKLNMRIFRNKSKFGKMGKQ